jgi:hypothetical protein
MRISCLMRSTFQHIGSLGRQVSDDSEAQFAGYVEGLTSVIGHESAAEGLQRECCLPWGGKGAVVGPGRPSMASRSPSAGGPLPNAANLPGSLLPQDRRGWPFLDGRSLTCTRTVGNDMLPNGTVSSA